MGFVDNATISGVLRRFVELSPEKIAQTSTYVDLLLKWNAKINLTSVRPRSPSTLSH